MIQDVKVTSPTNKTWRGIAVQGGNIIVRDCEIASTTSDGIECAGSGSVCFNYCHSCGGDGIGVEAGGSAASPFMSVFGNICCANAGNGISFNVATSTVTLPPISGNTCDSNGGAGITFVSPTAIQSLGAAVISNNILSNNTSYGLNFSAGSPTAAMISALGIMIEGNNTYNNLAAYNPASIGANDPGLNPQFINAPAGNFALGANLKGMGIPRGGTLHVGTGSSTYSYVDPGAAQRQEAGGTTIIVVDEE